MFELVSLEEVYSVYVGYLIVFLLFLAAAVYVVFYTYVVLCVLRMILYKFLESSNRLDRAKRQQSIKKNHKHIWGHGDYKQALGRTKRKNHETL